VCTVGVSARHPRVRCRPRLPRDRPRDCPRAYHRDRPRDCPRDRPRDRAQNCTGVHPMTGVERTWNERQLKYDSVGTAMLSM